MKKYLFLTVLATIAVVTSCQKEIDKSSEEEIEGYLTKIQAGSDESKTHLGTPEEGKVPVLWDATDEIWVRSQIGTAGVKFTTTESDITAGGKQAVFKGKVEDQGPWCAAFPYSMVASTSTCATITFNLPATQEYRNKSFGTNANPTVTCWASGNNVTFKNVNGVLKLTVVGTGTVSKIVVIDNESSAKLWGTLAVTLDYDSKGFSDATLTNTGSDANKLTLNCSSPITLDATIPTEFHFVLPDGVFTKGFTIEFYDSSSKLLKSIVTEKKIDISHSKICKLSDLDIDGIVFSGGSGTASSPYRIARAQDLIDLANYINSSSTNATYNDKYYRQLKDIDMSGVSAKAIGIYSSQPFSGNYDGQNYTISNLSVSPEGSGYNGLFGYANSATIKNIKLTSAILASTAKNSGSLLGYGTNVTVDGCTVSGSLDFTVKGCGGVVGYLNGGTVKNCSFSGTINSTAYSSDDAFAECAGVVGYTKNGTIESCSFSGKIEAKGQRIAGITSATASATALVKNCTVNKDSYLHCWKNEAGGIVGLVAGGTVDGCSFYGKAITEVQRAGGIVAQLRNGTVKNCFVGGDATIESVDTQAGGIAGFVGYNADNSTTVIDNCLCCGKVQGAARVGGIAGYYYSSGGTDNFTLTNSGFDGGTLIATLNLQEGSTTTYYIGMGGLLGCTTPGSTASTIKILNCWSSPALFRIRSNQVPYGSEAINHTNSPRVGGLLGEEIGNGNGTSINIEGCYSDIAKFQIQFGNKEWPDAVSKHYGGLYGKCSTGLKYIKDYCTVSIQYGPGYTGISTFDCEQVGNIAVYDGTLLDKLNAYVTSSGNSSLKKWVRGPEGHPVIDGGMTPVSSSQKRAPLRISVIGDSISTFVGWLSDGFHYYYPHSTSVTGCLSLTKVSQTYWWRLAYDYMKNAVIEQNIAWSGSLVTTQSAADIAEGGGKTQHYSGRSFAQRFMNHGDGNDGVGNPDIVLIKGGTNDAGKSSWNGSAWTGDKIATYLVRNSTGSIKNKGYADTQTVTDTNLAPDFNAGDAATTYEKAKALTPDSFSESFIQLIRLCQTKYPGVKIVCIISDSMSQTIEKTVIKIADHYGCKVVNLYRLDGKTAVLKNAIMPKTDWAEGQVGHDGYGCHPDPIGMEFVANKIYTELGSWLEGDVYSSGSDSASDSDFNTTSGQWF